jgi:hypothetical protein
MDIRFDGYIYFIRCGRFVKIGHSHDVERRRDDLMRHSPFNFRIVARYEALRTIEKDVHAAFHKHRHRGEWYRWCDRIEAACQSREAFDAAVNAFSIYRPRRAPKPKPATILSSVTM